MQSPTEELAQRAIQAALQSDWETAVKLNQEILQTDEENVETLNRLARALFESGSLSKATTTYKKVLKLDPYNPIASKNLDRLSNLSESTIKQAKPTTHLSPNIFLEEPGKTKIIAVKEFPSNKILAALRVGDQLELSSFHNNVKVSTSERKIIGRLEEVWGAKIANALRNGSQFTAVVKSVQIKDSLKDSSLQLFVKETFHSPKLPQPFFTVTTSNQFTPYIKEEALSILNSHGTTLDNGEEEDLNEEETHTNSHQESSLEGLAEQEIDQNQDDEENP